jgi:hypothetical protein
VVYWLQLMLGIQRVLDSSLGPELASLNEDLVFFFSYFTPVTAQCPKMTLANSVRVLPVQHFIVILLPDVM